MQGPDPLRPPPSLRPRPKPPKSRRWILATLLAVVAIGLPATLLLMKPNEDEPSREEKADEFVRNLVAGSNPVGRGPGQTGYAAAYDLLVDRRREAIPFDVFFEEWSRLLDSKGFIVDYVRTSEPRARDPRMEARVVKYVLFLGGDNQDHATLETVELKLNMTFNWKLGRYEVSEYSRANVPNPRATR
jgi:hypothetical protein